MRTDAAAKPSADDRAADDCADDRGADDCAAELGAHERAAELGAAAPAHAWTLLSRGASTPSGSVSASNPKTATRRPTGGVLAKQRAR